MGGGRDYVSVQHFWLGLNKTSPLSQLTLGPQGVRSAAMMRLFSLSALCGLGAFFAMALPSRADIETARAAGVKGDFAAAAAEWGKIAVTAKGEEKFDALLARARALRDLGQTRLALEVIKEAEKLAKSEIQIAEGRAASGAALMFSRRSGEAEPMLKQALSVARRLGAKGLIAQLQNDLGIVLSGKKDHAGAAIAFAEAVSAGSKEWEARARRNLAEARMAAGDFAAAKTELDNAVRAARELPTGHERVFQLLGLANTCERLFYEAPAHENALRRRAMELDAEAAKMATSLGDERALSWALGHQGALYEFERKLPEALALTRRALAISQRLQAEDSLHRWQAQTGRILAKQGDRDGAIQSYRRALVTLEAIRNDMAIRYGNPNAGSSYRKTVGAVYYELSDLLLQRADGLKDAELQTVLREARDTAESLKSAELEDYFQDDCVNLRRLKQRGVENLSKTAAVLYILPLEKRTELLLSLPANKGKAGRIERFKAAISDADLTEKVRSFRVNLENRTTTEFIEQAQQLHALFIAPVEASLKSNGIDTLVFVPDGSLRTIPMAALHDGTKFLIEKYAVAVTPGLELMEAGPKGLRAPRMMINGLTDAVQQFPPLPAVQVEVDRLGKLYPQSVQLMNTEFVKARVDEKFSGEPFTIVHIASHGEIKADVRESFVLTHSDRLTLDDLERLIRPGELADKPLELLTLSACQTAAGDDRAALGLGGVAVKAGARAAFATLWCVNDRASAELVADFYTGLCAPGGNTKAIALQNAQRRLLADPRYAHPCFWAPYLIIGNWL